MTLTGGSVVTSGVMRVGSTWQQGADAQATRVELTIDNGDVRVDRMVVGNGHIATGIVNVVNGTLSARQYSANGWGSAVGVTTLGAAGTLTAGELFASGTTGGMLTFDGGTLKPMFDAPYWLGGGTNTAGGATTPFATTITDSGATIDTDGFDVTVRNVLEDAAGHTGSLTKKGAGTLTLMGTGAYTGATTVDAGKLRIEANMNSGLITVKNAAELSIADSVSVKDITLEDGSSLNIGNSVGTLSADNLTLHGTTTWQVDLEGMSDSDRIVLSGTLTANLYGFDFQEFILDFMGGGENGGSYTLIQFAGIDSNLQASDFKVQNLAAGLDGTINIDSSQNELTLTVIPEPGTLGALGLLTVAALLRRRLRS
jgi:autotransporter-associated beta strand protein